MELSGFSSSRGYISIWMMNSASYKKTRIYTYCWLAQTFGNQIKYAIRNFWVTEALHPFSLPLPPRSHELNIVIVSVLLLWRRGSQLLLLIMPLAQVAAGDCAQISGGLDHKPAIQPLAPLTNKPSDSQHPCHPLPWTPQICNTCLSTGSLRPYSLNARWGILSHQQSHTAD